MSLQADTPVRAAVAKPCAVPSLSRLDSVLPEAILVTLAITAVAEGVRFFSGVAALGFISALGLLAALLLAVRLHVQRAGQQPRGPVARVAGADGAPDGSASLPAATEASTGMVTNAALLPGYKCVSMLEILYDVAASINVTRDVNEVLLRFLHTLTEILDAKAGVVRLAAEDGQMHLVASVGLDDGVLASEQVLPAKTCLCGKALAESEIFYQSDIKLCSRLAGRPLLPDDTTSMIVVPLRHRNRTLGVYNLYVSAERFELYKDLEELFTCIGRYLGMAIEKARLDEESNRLTIMDERARLAHELHDSLAQTLASVRFQVRVLDETLHHANEASMWALLEQIENSLDEANFELRELISHFRAPLDKQGVVPAVERVVERFRRESDIPIYLQKEWPPRRLPGEYEMHIIRIVQEALANIRKHSGANAVRVMLQGNAQGDYKVLIEDDGVGIKETINGGNPGEHIGLSIMRDRARRIGGTLTIESEPGEGTQIILEFKAPKALELILERAPQVAGAG